MGSYYERHKDAMKLNAKKWRENNHDRACEISRKYYHEGGGKQKIKEWWKKHPERTYDYMKRYFAKVGTYRDKLVKILGTKCAECGCSDMRCLQIDHINNDGYNDRKRFKTINSFYIFYVKHPKEAKKQLQILCANCNWIKRCESY